MKSQPPPGAKGPLFFPPRQVGPVNVLRDNVAQAVLGLTNIVHRYDVGMVQNGQDLGLGDIGLGMLRTADQVAMRHLDGDLPL